VTVPQKPAGTTPVPDLRGKRLQLADSMLRDLTSPGKVFVELGAALRWLLGVRAAATAPAVGGQPQERLL